MKMISKIACAGLGLVFAGSSVFAQSLADAKKAVEAEQYQKAKLMLKNLTTTQADKDENYFYLGWVYLKQDYPDSAKTAFNKGIAINPKSALNYAGLGAVAHVLKDNAGATSNFNQALLLAGKKNAKPFLFVGLSYLLPLEGTNVGPKGAVVAAADANAAIDVLNKGKLADPKDAEVLIALGDAYRSQLKSTDAYDNYSSALTLDPKNPSANVAEGVLWKYADNYDDSQKQFQAAIAIDPNFGPAYREWAEMDLRWAKTDPKLYDAKIKEAADNYKKYISLTDYSTESQMRYADFLLDAKDYVTLQKVAGDLSASAKSNLRVYRYLGYAAYENKDYPAAATALNKWISQAGNRVIPNDYLYLGRIEIANKQDSVGIIDLRKALTLDTSQVDLYSEIAKGLYAKGKYREAGDAYHTFAEKSRKATLQDHFFEGYSFFLEYTNTELPKAEKNKTYKADTTLLTKADSAFTYVERKTTKPNAQVILFHAYVKDYEDNDRNNIRGLAKPFYEQYISLITAAGAVADKNKGSLANAYVYLANYAENKEKDDAKALDLYTKAKEQDPTNAQVVYWFATKGKGKTK